MSILLYYPGEWKKLTGKDVSVSIIFCLVFIVSSGMDSVELIPNVTPLLFVKRSPFKGKEEEGFAVWVSVVISITLQYNK